jgi:hypothetical protein
LHEGGGYGDADAAADIAEQIESFPISSRSMPANVTVVSGTKVMASPIPSTTRGQTKSSLRPYPLKIIDNRK